MVMLVIDCRFCTMGNSLPVHNDAFLKLVHAKDRSSIKLAFAQLKSVKLK